MGLLAFSVALLTLAFAPYEQFYLAWVGLVPWLIVVASARTSWRAFAWGWLGGAGFFAVNLSWIFRATVPGAIALIIYLALFWGLAAAVIRWSDLMAGNPARLAQPWRAALLAVLGLPAVWVATEWIRGTLFTGFPWIPIAQTQSPLLAMCQIADFASMYGVSFWVVAVNAGIAVAIVHRTPATRAIPLRAAGVLAMLVSAALAYGLFRLSEDALYPGPRVMVVQPSFIHERGGARLVTQEEQLEFHFPRTRDSLTEAQEPVDVVVWSETVMPALNPDARDEPGLGAAPFLRSVDAALRQLAASHGTAIVTGGYYVGGWEGEIGTRRASDIRNAVYVYHRDGTQDPQRYDKIHLVPFGEFLPFERSFPPLFRVLRYFAGYSVDYSINWASPDAMTVFTVAMRADGSASQRLRLITPICYEDVDPALIARMLRPGAGDDPETKRADVIVNVTNDGWFLGNQQAQHLQHAIFRSIENRIPTARACNTGISGFIDSAGRINPGGLLPVRTEGELTNRIMLDRRLAPYTRWGDLFVYACTLAAGLLVLGQGIRRRMRHVEAGAR